MKQSTEVKKYSRYKPINEEKYRSREIFKANHYEFVLNGYLLI